MTIQQEQNSRALNFVLFILAIIKKDTGCAAALRRADNPTMEYQSWEYLARFGVHLDNSSERLPFATVAAAIAKAKAESNGTMGIGQALAECYEEGSESNQAKIKFRRLLACDSIEEACRILRPLLNLILANTSIDLNYERLLKDLLWFNTYKEKIKSQWAQNFYLKNKEVAV